MLQGIGKVFFKAFSRRLANIPFRLQHVKSMHVCMIYIHLCRDAGLLKIVYEGHGFGIERLPVADESIGGRKARIICLSCGRR